MLSKHASSFFVVALSTPPPLHTFLFTSAGGLYIDVDGADFDITADDEVKECKVKKCEVNHIKRKESVFSYRLG